MNLKSAAGLSNHESRTTVLESVDVKLVFVLDRYCLCLLHMARTKSTARKPGKGPGIAAKASTTAPKEGLPPK